MSMVGKAVDRYQVVEQLGQGGMAVVYKAYDTRLERAVALKVIRTENVLPSQHEKFLQRFEREAKAQAQFSHTNIVKIYDYGEFEGAPYLVMELHSSGTLRDHTGTAMPIERAAALLSPIASALAYAHARNVLHRDVKPSNILIDEYGTPFLTDFGIAKLLETDQAALTGTGLGVGTPEYMAPEQWKGQSGPATDIYALGVVLYELVTGRKPYTADTPAAVAIRQATEPLPMPRQFAADLNDEAEQIILKALALKPEDRFESMAAFGLELSKLQADLTATKIESSTSSQEFTEQDQALTDPEDVLTAIDSELRNTPEPMPSEKVPGDLRGFPPAPPPSLARVESPQKTRSRPRKVSVWVWVTGALGLAIVGLMIVAGIIAFRLSQGTASPSQGSLAATAAPTAATARRDNPYSEIPFTQPLVVAAASCDYGGKISSIEATDRLTVVFNLCKPDPAFLAKAAFTPFGIQPREYLDYAAASQLLLEAPVGTGPYQVTEWERGDHVSFTAFADYWGAAPAAQTAVLRWAAEGSARLVELQAGTADMITNVSPADIATVQGDPNLQLIFNVNPNIFYVGFTNTFAPFDNADVRRAIAMGLDRQRVVDNYYPAGSEVASHFTPCSIPNGCAGDSWYETNLEEANAMLDAAGFPRNEDGVRFETSIYYRDVFRVYQPEPGLVAVEISNQLRENLGIEAEVVVMESGEFINASTSGQLDGIHLLGWGADYPHVTNFLDFHFGSGNPQFGTAHPEIYEALEAAAILADVAAAEPHYVTANNAIRDLVPMIPIAHGASADAALASVSGAYVPPFGATQFQYLDPGKDTLVFVQNAEPISLYCADETDGESLRPCQQAVETLLEYGQDSGDISGELATACTGNADSTVWTCTLRDGVTFHDGSSFDANDVVASWAAGIDAANANHIGNTGTFDYFAYLWDGLINDN